jgi:septal ring-binding cell division protein DamX
MAKISKRSAEVFRLYAEDAANWSGMPLVGGNVSGSKEDRGNITQLKRAGLIKTQEDDGNMFILFTAAGKAFAQTMNIEIENTLSPTGEESKETIEMTETKTATPKTAKPKTEKPAKTAKAKTAKPAKTAKAKTAKPKTEKPAKTAKPAKSAGHAFQPAKDEPAQCSVCGNAPSAKAHRRALDQMRSIWRNETAAVRAAHVGRIKDVPASTARLAWTEVPAEIKHALAAKLEAAPLPEAK